MWRKQIELCKINKVKERLGVASHLFMILINY